MCVTKYVQLAGQGGMKGIKSKDGRSRFALNPLGFAWLVGAGIQPRRRLSTSSRRLVANRGDCRLGRRG